MTFFAFCVAIRPNSLDWIGTCTIAPISALDVIFNASASEISIAGSSTYSTMFLSAYTAKSHVSGSMVTCTLSALPKWFLQAWIRDCSIASSSVSLLIFFSFSRISSASINSLFIFFLSSRIYQLKLYCEAYQGCVFLVKNTLGSILIDCHTVTIICG